MRSYSSDPRQWSAFESLDKQGKRHLNINPGHFDKLERLQQNVKNRHAELRSLRAAFVAESGVQFGNATTEGFCKQSIESFNLLGSHEPAPSCHVRSATGGAHGGRRDAGQACRPGAASGTPAAEAAVRSWRPHDCEPRR